MISAQAPGTPTFEVASIRRNTSDDPRVMIGGPPGRFSVTNAPLRLLIRNAYRLQDFQVVGGPAWLNSDRFDIVAKAEGSATPDQIQAMVRSLLVERFKLVTHTETREMPIYALVPLRGDGKLGEALRPAAADCSPAARGRGGEPAGRPAPPQPGEPIRCGMMVGPGSVQAGGQPISQLATLLAPYVSRIVVDRTGLAGAFDFTLQWTPEGLPPAPAAPPPPGGGPGLLPPVDPNGPSIFTAVQEQLGLKLDAQRGAVDVLVIDSVTAPTDE